jgi:hypothetical protein
MSSNVTIRPTPTNESKSSPDNDDCESEESTDKGDLFSDTFRVDSASEVDSIGVGGQCSVQDDNLLKRIAFHKSQGRSRSRRKAWSQSLVERELDFWQQWVVLHLSSIRPLGSTDFFYAQLLSKD